MIRTESLTKFYGQRCAVRDLDLEISDNEIVGFLGRNGAGKTTTLRMLAGMLAPSSGRIHIDGREMDPENAADVRWRIGFLPQDPPLYDEMTVRGYLGFAAELRGVTSRVKERVDEVIDMVDAGAYRDARVSSLSSGYRQRVGIAQAVIHDPALVILDEPTSQLDPAQLREMRTLIRQLKDRHTVLLSSHNLPEISQTCDRLLVIHQGELVESGDEASLRARMHLPQRYLLTAVGAKKTVDSVVAKLKKQGILSDAKVQHGTGESTLDVGLTRDEPAAVAKAVVEAGLGLIRLQPQEQELEALFMQLTTEEQSS